MLAVIGRGNNAQVHIPALNLIDNIIAAAVYNFKAHQGKFSAETGNPPCRQKGRQTCHTAQAQRAGQAHDQSAYLFPCALCQIQQLGRTAV